MALKRISLLFLFSLLLISIVIVGAPNSTRHLFPSEYDSSVNHTICGGHGVMVGKKCDCFYPYTGEHCLDFACEHGLSVGTRYDPTSIFFNKKCICDEDWSGDLCHIPIADQCNERGQYVNGRCICHGFYFGPRCQYVGKCAHGKLTEGICQCNYGYDGDYCDLIVCHHGYPDKHNNSESCICPPRHTGMFCDECLLQGSEVLPFPNCTTEKVPLKAKLSRIKTNQLILKRLWILLLVFVILVLIVVTMIVLNWGHKRNAKLDNEELRNHLVNERQFMLQQMFRPPKRKPSSPYCDPERLDHQFL